MATHKKDEPEKPKPANVVVYMPNKTLQAYTEGESGVKEINWVSPHMLSVKLDDGKIMTFANIPFQFNSYPKPPVKKEARL